MLTCYKAFFTFLLFLILVFIYVSLDIKELVSGRAPSSL